MSQNAVYECALCHGVFRSLPDLNQHQQVWHQVPDYSWAGPVWPSCNQGVVFDTAQSALGSTTGEHSMSRPQPCVTAIEAVASPIPGASGMGAGPLSKVRRVQEEIPTSPVSDGQGSPIVPEGDYVIYHWMSTPGGVDRFFHCVEDGKVPLSFGTSAIFEARLREKLIAARMDGVREGKSHQRNN